MTKLWINYYTKMRFNIQNERQENKKEREDYYLILNDMLSQ